MHIGVDDDLPLNDQKRIRLINLCFAIGVLLSFGLALQRVFVGKYELALVNLFYAVVCLFVFVLHNARKYNAANLYVSFGFWFIFATTAFIFKNGTEFYLLLNVVLTSLLHKNKWFVIGMSALNSISFLFIQLYHSYAAKMYNEPIGQKNYISMSVTLIIITIVLYIFRNENYKYQKEAERKNNLLENQQGQLLQQKNSLEAQNKTLLNLNNTKEKLFSIIAHDIRQPLSSLKGSLRLIDSDMLTEAEFKRITKQLEYQVDNLFINMDNLLVWSQSQLNGIKAKQIPFNIGDSFNKIISLFESVCQTKNIYIRQTIPADILVLADINHIEIVIRNLLSNALKYSYSNSSIFIDYELHTQYMKIFIKDSGTGIKPAMIDQLFKMHVQSERGTFKEKGNGIGLVLCKEFLESNNCAIAVESNYGNGSTFSFTIPLHF